VSGSTEATDWLDPLIVELRRLPEPGPAARARLQKALHRERPGARMILLSPMRAAFAAAVIIAATSLSWSLGAWSASTESAAPGLTPVQFVIVAPDANSVAIAGDFNGWSSTSTPLAPGADGVWSVVVPLEAGTFAYSFIVDGREWRADPQAVVSTEDFGRPSSLMFVNPET
jgi:hypothetical protein